MTITNEHRYSSWRNVLLLVALLGIAADVLADDPVDRVKALEQKLERSLRLIEQLTHRIGELEKKVPPGSAATATITEPSPPPERPSTSIATLQEEIDQINQGLSLRGFDFGLPIHGFADVQAAASSAADPLRLKGFNGGTLDLYLTPQFGNRIRSLIEIAVEYEPGTRSTAIDMERLQLGYTVSDELTLWMGRFHTPFGVWNTSFHHGANLQTSIYRPRFIEFEDRGGIIPAHSVGLWGNGKADVGAGKLTYDVYISNGPSIRDRELDFHPFTDADDRKMFGVNFGFQPSGVLRGLSAGLHGFTSRVAVHSASDAVVNRSHLQMAGAYSAYDAKDWEIFAEYYRFFNRDDLSDVRHKSHAGFIHAGRTFGTLTPYLRYERVSLDPTDIYFNSQRTGRSYTRQVVGSRYALDARSSVKFELSRTDEAALNQYDGTGIVLTPRSKYQRAAFQYSIAF
ncbi:MAG: hypothetical protein ABI520_05515 [Caldimonas sp.]